MIKLSKNKTKMSKMQQKVVESYKGNYYNIIDKISRMC